MTRQLSNLIWKWGVWWLAAALVVQAPAQSSAPLTRLPNTSLAMPSAPPTFGYTATNAFGTLTFVNPVAIASPPGETNRIFIVEKNGTIQVIPNLAAPTKTLFLDISDRVTSTTGNSGGSGEQGLLGLAFHPGYATNGYFFVFYLGDATTPAGTGRHDILSRFEISAANTNQADESTEVRLIAQYDQQPNHDGGDIQFGPDGYLYVPLGDEGGGNDSQNNSQRINKDFFSAMLRIDVDKLPGSLNPNPHASIITPTNYAVPPDNPFVGATSFNGAAVNPNQVRTEFWAVGLRNPWRIHFDSLTGALYCADVGQAGREEVSIITRGGNYGWNYYEGFANGPATPSAGFTNYVPPLLDYSHTAGRVCIIGGVVSRGARLAQLYGAYLYAEYATGEIWYIRHSGSTITESNLLINPPNPSERVVTFGTDPSNGDVLYAAHFTTGYATDAEIRRIVYNNVTNGAPIPPTLAQTGAFTNLTTLTPHAGIVPYDINVPFWSDDAIKSRWFSVPNTNLVIGFNSNANWSFPTGTVWIKHFDLELTNGAPASRKRLETRLLVKNSAGVYGVTYRWGDSLTNAALVPESGLDEPFTINEGGVLRTQVWHYPSRIECQVCHTPEGGFGLGFNTPQLNYNFDYGSGPTNQVAALSKAGYFSTTVTNTSGLPALAHATNTAASLEHRARSYLSANCVQCHQPGGSAQQADWDARITTPTALAGLIYGPLADDLGNASNRVVTPLSLANSALHTRIATRGPNQMPPLATSVVDTQNVALVAQWIGSLSNTFWVGATPASRTTSQGGTTTYSVSVLPTSDFTGSVALVVSGLPPGASAGFAPLSVTGSNSSTLTVTSSVVTPLGNYLLMLTGSGSGRTNTSTATLIIGNAMAAPGTLLWDATSGISANTNWSGALNWTNLTAGGNGSPGPLNDVLFGNAGDTTASNNVNNVVGTNTTINSLVFTNTDGFHTTLIAPGRTLTITGGAPGFANTPAINVGLESYTVADESVRAAITGAGGRLVISNSSASVQIRQGFGSGTVGTFAALDFSGLGAFTADMRRAQIGVESGTPRRVSGVWQLARTNHITLNQALDVNSTNLTSGTPALVLGHNTQVGNSNSAALYLGITNAIHVNHIVTGRGNQTGNWIAFNPAFLASNPVVRFRASDGTGRVGQWVLGDNSAGSQTAPSSGTNDFTGGTLDALVDRLFLGRGRNGNTVNTGIGVLTFNAGTLDANTLRLGTMVDESNSTNASGVGTMNVNGSATLRVNSVLELGHVNTIVPAAPAAVSGTRGTLIVNGGTVRAASIVNAGGTANISLSTGTLVVTNTAGTPPAPLNSLSLANGTLRLRVNGSSIVTNVVAASVTASGVNSLAIDSVVNVTAPTAFPLVSYATLSGSVAGNFSVGALPSGFSGTLSNNTARKTIDFRLTSSVTTTPRFGSIALSGSSLIMSGSNGIPNWSYYVLASTNVSLPLAQWARVATHLFDGSGNFSFTNALSAGTPRQFYLLQLP